MMYVSIYLGLLHLVYGDVYGFHWKPCIAFICVFSAQVSGSLGVYCITTFF